MRTIWMMLAASVASPAVAADQFDLICKGRTKRDAAHFRIDLKQGEWCREDCRGTFKIASVTEGRLTLEDSKPAFRGDAERSIWINRISGEYAESGVAYKGAMPDSSGGTCEASEFSGFPAKKF